MIFNTEKNIETNELIDLVKKANSSIPRTIYENVDTLSYKEQSGNIIIDYSYQRNYVQTNETASSYIESIFLGLVIPEIQIFEDKRTGVREIVDGQQRVLSLLKFYRNEYPLTKLSVLSDLNGYKFKDLPEPLQNIIKNFEVCIRISSSDDSLYKYILFERLNTGSKILNTQEVRNCVFRGEMLDKIKTISNYNDVRENYSLLNNERFDVDEQILNVISLTYFLEIERTLKTPDTMKLRINTFLNEIKTFDKDYRDNLINRFLQVSTFINDNIDILSVCKEIQPNSKNQKNVSKTFLEALYPALLNNDLESLENINKKLLNSNISYYLSDETYIETTGGGHNKSMKRVNARISMVNNVIYKTIESQNIGLDSKRTFSLRDKAELFLLKKAENETIICPICNQPIYDIDLAEVDHITPWSKGGQTVLSNGQLVHSRCNKQKSNKY